MINWPIMRRPGRHASREKTGLTKCIDYTAHSLLVLAGVCVAWAVLEHTEVTGVRQELAAHVSEHSERLASPSDVLTINSLGTEEAEGVDWRTAGIGGTVIFLAGYGILGTLAAYRTDSFFAGPSEVLLAVPTTLHDN